MTHPAPRPDEAELARIAAVTCPQDRGEDPFAWSDLPPAPAHTEHPTTDTTSTEEPPPTQTPAPEKGLDLDGLAEPDAWMTPRNRQTTAVLELQPLYGEPSRPGGEPRLLGQFWGPPGGPAHHGAVSGPGFRALGDNFPPGTRLTVTAVITLPDGSTDGRSTTPRDTLTSDVPARPHPGDTGDTSGDPRPDGVRFAYRATVRRNQVHQAIAEAFDLLGAELAHQPDGADNHDA